MTSVPGSANGILPSSITKKQRPNLSFKKVLQLETNPQIDLTKPHKDNNIFSRHPENRNQFKWMRSIIRSILIPYSFLSSNREKEKMRVLNRQLRLQTTIWTNCHSIWETASKILLIEEYSWEFNRKWPYCKKRQDRWWLSKRKKIESLLKSILKRLLKKNIMCTWPMHRVSNKWIFNQSSFKKKLPENQESYRLRQKKLPFEWKKKQRTSLNIKSKWLFNWKASRKDKFKSSSEHLIKLKIRS